MKGYLYDVLPIDWEATKIEEKEKATQKEILNFFEMKHNIKFHFGCIGKEATMYRAYRGNDTLILVIGTDVPPKEISGKVFLPGLGN